MRPTNVALVGLGLLCLVVAACRPNVATAKRGTLDLYRDGQMISSRPLIEAEARDVAAWVNAHGSGWSRNQIAVPLSMVVRLVHSNRDVTMVNLAGDIVVVSNSAGQFRKTLTPAEAAELRAVAGVSPKP